MKKIHISPASIAALSAAILFGASTPFAKQLIGNTSPILLAGLLYLGSGIGLFLLRLIKDFKWINPGLLKQEWFWLLSSIFFGGILGPILFMMGLLQTTASITSLLLNLESVFTAILAWVVFKEHTDRRIIIGMFLIVLGGIVLAWQGQFTNQDWRGVLFIMGACLCWAIDNNLTRNICSSDSLFLAGSKGFVAGVVNIGLALFLRAIFPDLTKTFAILTTGFLGYGISLVLFIFALRGLGTGRTGAFFSTAPFIGATIAIIFFHESASITFVIAAILMGIGVWIHITEYHEHEHVHEELFHNHSHFHDEHHQHEHDFNWDGKEPHKHSHHHKHFSHTHSHFPDIHHRHKH